MPWRIRPTPLAFVAILALVLAAIIVSKAWICDDAYITLRTVDNLQHGLGPRWNAAERVQAFTHPLWMLLLAAITGLTHEHYLTTMAVGLAVTGGALAVVGLRLARGAREVALVLALLATSQAWTDYATAGLENPLQHLVLACFCVAFLGPSRGRTFDSSAIWITAALAACTRLDSLVLCAPPLAWLAWREPDRRIARDAARGLCLIAAWLVFALVYYGAALPNSAVAKLATGLPATELVRQSGAYFLASLRLDPATLLVTCVGACVAIRQRDARAVALAVGIGLHLLYVAGVGGDFMSGRLLTPSLFAAVLLVSRMHWSRRAAVGFVAVCAAATGIASWSAARRAAPLPAAERALASIDSHGIADERRFYARLTGLRFRRRDVPWPDPATQTMAAELRAHWAEDPFVGLLMTTGLLDPDDALPADAEAEVRLGTARPVVIRAAVGTLGFDIGPDVHVLDLYALGDPLRARLPALPRDPLVRRFLPRLGDLPYRPGHYVRRIPAGYVATLVEDRSHLVDADIESLWRDVSSATRGPLFAPGRAGAILRLAHWGPDPRGRRWMARAGVREAEP